MKVSIEQQFVDQKVLYGSRFQRFVREFLLNSGIFWLFDTVYKVGENGFITHLLYVPQWVLLAASLIQAWIISIDEQVVKWWYPFIAPTLYTLVDVWIEGPLEFISEPYHLFYWGWSAVMSIALILSKQSKILSLFLKAFLLVILLPTTYLFAELDGGLVFTSEQSLFDYWLKDSAHFFILFGTVLLGIALGITTAMRERFEKLLYNLATHFEQVASWSFDSNLIRQAYTDDLALDLQRIERAVLFMDIRGFTPWSEAHSAEDVVQLVNTFYQAAEPIIKANDGFKIQMTGDEIMTRFSSAEAAVQAALELQPMIAKTLKPHGLSAGIGIHVGEVVEGLVGGLHTKQYGIFGDTVNTSARLQGQAQAHEIVISEAVRNRTHSLLNERMLEQRAVNLKGKAEAMQVTVIPFATNTL